MSLSIRPSIRLSVIDDK